uniref:Uncharacterized protein n=1 Tax=Kalanchoe fedtschenkoi TaxID=63787 RepID=A0A7N0UNP1_KALFE
MSKLKQHNSPKRNGMQLIERHRVSPPQNSVPMVDLPLTYLDVFWIPFSHTQRFFLYKHPFITAPYFLREILPGLKDSLSVCLQHYFPLAGSLVIPPETPSKPHIHYEDGHSVALTIMESSKDFASLLGAGKNSLIRQADYDSLVPDLVINRVVQSPLLALQVTIFPNSGISLGVTYRHAVADGKSMMGFLNTWSAVFRNSGIMPENNFVPPVIDRSLISDPDDIIKNAYFNQFPSLATLVEITSDLQAVEENPIARATFLMKRHEIQQLRKWVSARAKNEDLYLSTFVLLSSLTWVNLVKSETAAKISPGSGNDDDRPLCHFFCAVDCRDRYEFKSQVPSAYFGNCLAVMDASAKRAELESENGLIIAVRAIGEKIKEMERRGALKDAALWFAKALESHKTGTVFSIAGSPRLGVYGLDFGWGRPEKVEVVSIDAERMSLAEARDDDSGGVEIGMALRKKQMEAFMANFEKSKSDFWKPLRPPSF